MTVEDAPVVDLRGKRGLVVGIANEHSIAAGCAGATLAATYLNAKSEPFVRAVTGPLDCPIVTPCDVRAPGQLEAVFERLGAEWGGLDFVLHSIAFAPAEDLHGRVTDCSAAGFLVSKRTIIFSLAAFPPPSRDRFSVPDRPSGDRHPH